MTFLTFSRLSSRQKLDRFKNEARPTIEGSGKSDHVEFLSKSFHSSAFVNILECGPAAILLTGGRNSR